MYFHDFVYQKIKKKLKIIFEYSIACFSKNLKYLNYV